MSDQPHNPLSVDLFQPSSPAHPARPRAAAAQILPHVATASAPAQPPDNHVPDAASAPPSMHDLPTHGPRDQDHQLANLRMPPHSLEAETGILGALMLDNGAWDNVSDLLTTGDFYRYEHRLIFEAIRALIEQNKAADVITVYEWLKASGQDAPAGGLAYLNSLAQFISSASNLRRYAEIVRERSILRHIVSAGDQMATQALNPQGKSADDVLDASEQLLYSIGEDSQRGKGTFQPLPGLVATLLDELETRADNPNDVTGLPTGWLDLDHITTGLQPGDLIVLAARPSMGKTAFAINIAENAAKAHGKRVAVFSMEMGAGQLAVRIVGSLARVNQGNMRTGKLSPDEWSRLAETVEQMRHLQLHIDETAGLTVGQLRANARKLARQLGGLDLIVVDYLQLMSGSGGGSDDNRASELGEISRGLKMLAKELHCPVIALSQLNRSVEQRADKRPMMSDLRESGAIEQDADIIMFIYRDEYYTKDACKEPGVAEILIAKQRNGPTGTVKLAFLNALTRFESLST